MSEAKFRGSEAKFENTWSICLLQISIISFLTLFGKALYLVYQINSFSSRNDHTATIK